MATFKPILDSDKDTPVMVGNTAIIFTQTVDFDMFGPALPQITNYVKQKPDFRSKTGFANISVAYDAGETGVVLLPNTDTGNIDFQISKMASGLFDVSVTLTTNGGDAYPPFWDEDGGIEPAADYWESDSKTFTFKVLVLGQDAPWTTGAIYATCEVGKYFKWSLPFNTSFGSKWNTYSTYMATSAVQPREAGWLQGEYLYGDLKVSVDGEDVSCGLTTRNVGCAEDGLRSWSPVEVAGTPTVAGICHFDVEVQIYGYAAWANWPGGSYKIPVIIDILDTYWIPEKAVIAIPQAGIKKSITLSGLSIGTPNLNGEFTLSPDLINGRVAYTCTRDIVAWDTTTTTTFRIWYYSDTDFTGWVLHEVTATGSLNKSTALYYHNGMAGVDYTYPPAFGWEIGVSTYSGDILLCRGDAFVTNAPGISGLKGFYDEQGVYNEHALYAQCTTDGSHLIYVPESASGFAIGEDLTSVYFTSGSGTFPTNFSTEGSQSSDLPAPSLKVSDAYVLAAYLPPRLLSGLGEAVAPIPCTGGTALQYLPSIKDKSVPAHDLLSVPALFGLLPHFPKHWELAPYPWADWYTANFLATKTYLKSHAKTYSSDTGSEGAKCDRTDPVDPQKVMKDFPHTVVNQQLTEHFTYEITDQGPVDLNLMGLNGTRVAWLEHRGAAAAPTFTYSFSENNTTEEDDEVTYSHAGSATGGNFVPGTQLTRVYIQPFGSNKKTFTFGELEYLNGGVITGDIAVIEDGGSSTEAYSKSVSLNETVRGLNKSTSSTPPRFTCPLTEQLTHESRTSSASLTRVYRALNDTTAVILSETRSETQTWNGTSGTRTWAAYVTRTDITFDESEMTSNVTTVIEDDSGSSATAVYTTAQVNPTISKPTGKYFLSWAETDSFEETVETYEQEVSLL